MRRLNPLWYIPALFILIVFAWSGWHFVWLVVLFLWVVIGFVGDRIGGRWDEPLSR